MASWYIQGLNNKLSTINHRWNKSLCYQNYISVDSENYETEANLLIVNCSTDITIISGSECSHYTYAHTDSILNFPSWLCRQGTSTRTCDVTLGQDPGTMSARVPMVWCVVVDMGDSWTGLLHHCQQLQVFIALVTLLHVTNITWHRRVTLAIVTTFLVLLPSSSNQS